MLINFSAAGLYDYVSEIVTSVTMASPIYEFYLGGSNDGLFPRNYGLFQTIVTLPSVLSAACESRRVDTWHIVYLSNKDPCPKISVNKSEIKVP